MSTEQLIISVSERGSLVVKRNLEGVGHSATRASRGVTMLKGALAALGIASAAMVTVSSVRLLADFSQQMSTVQAVTGATETEFRALRETAKQLGETTRYTASQAAEAMVNLSRAGFSAKETIESVEQVLRLAQAGAMDLATSARLTTQALRGFGLEVDQAGRVADVLAKAANSANTDVVMLGEGLKFVAPIAAGLNVELEESVVVLQALADAGLQATLGGTGFRMMLNKLERPTGEARAVLSELGLTAAEVSVSTHGLTKVMQLLQERGMTTGQALALFGARAGSAGAIVTRVAHALPEMTKALQEAEGYAARTAHIMDANLNGALLRVKAAIQAVDLEFGDLGTELLLTRALNQFAEGTRWVARNLGTLTKVTQTAAVMLGVVFARQALGAALTGVKALGAAVAKLWALIAAHPLLALATVIAGVITALYSFRNEIYLLGGDLVTLGDLGSAAMDELRFALGLLARDGSESFEELEQKGSNTLDNLKLFGLSMLQTLLQVVDKVVGAIVGVFMGTARAVLMLIDNIKRRTRPSLKELGLAFSEEVLEGMMSSNLEDAFLSILDRAEDKALARMAEAIRAVREQSREELERPTAPEIELPEALPAAMAPTWAELRAGLEQEVELLRLSNQEREIRRGLLDLESQMQDKLSESEEAEARVLLETAQALQLQNQVYQEIRGPQEEYILRLEALNQLLEDQKITLDEYTQKLAEMDGVITDLVQETGLGEILGESLFYNASRALDDFIGGAEVSFQGLAHSIMQDLAQILGRLLMMKALMALGVPGLPGFQHGGSFKVGGTGGTDSQLVAFKATPGEHVTVTRPGESSSGGAAVPVQTTVPVTIMNQVDSGMVLGAMDTAEGGKVIMNVISRNANTVRRVLGG